MRNGFSSWHCCNVCSPVTQILGIVRGFETRAASAFLATVTVDDDVIEGTDAKEDAGTGSARVNKKLSHLRTGLSEVSCRRLILLSLHAVTFLFTADH